ncbi:hypothetical protein E4U13_007707 [Claviceps humidiphila]|uniref:Phosphatidylglycerol/phosphatidylinositol transfer protein n=2 Tax=Claviceps TaxID=5110 RepID=A0A9P7MPV3_9HYPO|nr:hypothetical protein E4U57_001570 [Claviceps arundinis]KAG5965177.1 hypothetical protein E4U56_001877 [Claviceps arundinis]KAG6105739.1 hypothetical protein E4U13_007707 [Claviceps humidiphila]
MRISVAILSALVVPLAALSIRDVDSPEDVSPTKDDMKLPGQSLIEHCLGKKTEEFIKFERFLVPKPPVPGKDFVYTTTVFLQKTIEKKAYMELTVHYGLVRILGMKLDFCQQLGGFRKVDYFKCHYRPFGIPHTITKTLTIPRDIPPGTYTVVADVYTVDHERIICLTTTVKFDKDSWRQHDDDEDA